MPRPGPRVRKGVPFAAVPRALTEALPELGGKAPLVLLLAMLEARPGGGGVWAYGSSREVGAAVGISGSAAREAICLLEKLGLFLDHRPPANAGATGSVLLSPAIWPYTA